ncbi:hypothetical protein [Blautia sp.]|uniref:hypothetical protein n=1 Tax=Blautia sp. TaxID=1955243 RepID=UPI003AB4A99A
MRRFFSKEKSRKEKKADFYILYTIVFAAISLVIYGCFYFNGKSLVWSHDGVPQHINALAYYGKYLRNVLKTLELTIRYRCLCGICTLVMALISLQHCIIM